MNAPTASNRTSAASVASRSFCLTVVLLVELVLVLWINPKWFDRMAFWRGPRYEPHITLVDNPEAWARWAEEQSTTGERSEPQPPGERVDFDFGRVATHYEPASGAELAFSETASLKVPPGAIGIATEISMTPLLRVSDEMAAPFAGPAVDLRIGDREHYTFQRPVTLTLPYEGLSDGDLPAIACWENGRWVAFPSRIDREKKTITAELPHASVAAPIAAIPTPALVPQIAGSTLNLAAAAGAGTSVAWPVGVAGLAAVGAVAGTSTGRAQVYSAAWWVTSGLEYETPRGNFKIHYVTTGKHAVPDDKAFREAGVTFGGKNTPDGHPLYVRYLGELLEDCLTGFNKMGLDVPVVKIIRHDVFVQGIGHWFGATQLGGPLFVSSELISLAARARVPADEIIRYAAARELTNVALDEHFSALTARYSGWFIDLMAAYVAFHYWEDQGRPLKRLLPTSVVKGGVIPQWPMDAGGLVIDPYFVFPRWLDQGFGTRAGLKFLVAAAESWLGHFVELEDLDAAGRKTLKGGNRGLADLFTEFALDFFHNEFWKGHGRSPGMVPGYHTGAFQPVLMEALSLTDKKFINVSIGLPGTSWHFVNPWASHEFGVEEKHGRRHLPHLSAEAVYMSVGEFPETQKAKLVVRFESNEPVSPDLALYMGKDECIGFAPYPGRPDPMEKIPLAPDKLPILVIDQVGQESHPDCVTVVAVNRSLEESVRGVNVQRWLLVPPENVRYWQTPANTWQVEWDEVALKNYPEVWREYQVFRKLAGQPNSAFSRVDRTRLESYDYDPGMPSTDDYVFTVSVIDEFGNESHPAPVPNRDPFVGDWSGFVRETHGLYLTKSMVQVRSIYNEQVDQERARIRRLPTATDHERSQKREAQEDQKFMEELGGELIKGVEEVAPALGKLIRSPGLPAKFSIRRFDGEYYLTVKSVALMPVSDPMLADIPLKPSGFRSLTLKSREAGLLSEVQLFSPRESFINSPADIVRSLDDPKTGTDYEFRFSWIFARKD